METEKDDRKAPESFLLLRFGENKFTKDGKENGFDFTSAHADALIAEFAERGRDLVIDFEHQSLKGIEAPAAGWIDRLEKSADGLHAHVKYWTDKGSDYLAKGEYRYFSPTLYFSPASQGPASVHSVALTNHPALHCVDALVAHDLNPKTSVPSDTKRKDLTMIKTEIALRYLLGDSALALSDDADAGVAARLTALADELPGLRAKAAECETLKNAKLLCDKEAVFERGAKRGAFSNAQKETLFKLSLEDLEKHESATPDAAAVPTQKLPAPGEKDPRKEELSEEEKEMARKMNLSDEEFIAARKACQKETE